MKGWGSGLFQVGIILFLLTGCDERTFFPPQNSWAGFGLFIAIIGAIIYIGGYLEQEQVVSEISSDTETEENPSSESVKENAPSELTDESELKQKLKVLENLYNDKLLSEEEYNQKRKDIIDKI